MFRKARKEVTSTGLAADVEYQTFIEDDESSDFM